MLPVKTCNTGTIALSTACLHASLECCTKPSLATNQAVPVHAKYSRCTIFHQHPHLCNLSVLQQAESWVHLFWIIIWAGCQLAWGRHPGTRDWENRFQLHSVIRKTLVCSRMSRCLAKERIIWFNKQYGGRGGGGGKGSEDAVGQSSYARNCSCSSPCLWFISWRGGSWWEGKGWGG